MISLSDLIQLVIMIFVILDYIEERKRNSHNNDKKN